jgi:hypothetical protein
MSNSSFMVLSSWVLTEKKLPNIKKVFKEYDEFRIWKLTYKTEGFFTKISYHYAYCLNFNDNVYRILTVYLSYDFIMLIFICVRLCVYLEYSMTVRNDYNSSPPLRSLLNNWNLMSYSSHKRIWHGMFVVPGIISICFDCQWIIICCNVKHDGLGLVIINIEPVLRCIREVNFKTVKKCNSDNCIKVLQK